MKFKLFIFFVSAVVVAGCSHWKSGTPPASRTVASIPGLSCHGLMDNFFTRPMPYSEAQFSVDLREMGLGQLYQGAKDLSRRGEQQEAYAEIAAKLEEHFRKGVDYRAVVDDLNPS